MHMQALHSINQMKNRQNQTEDGPELERFRYDVVQAGGTAATMLLQSTWQRCLPSSSRFNFTLNYERKKY